jgi:hypothetical protein
MTDKLASDETIAVAAALSAFSKAIDASGGLSKRAVALMWRAVEIANIPPETRSAITKLANLIEGAHHD